MTSASIKDVATLAGVSVGTVSNVLNRPESVSPKTAERVTRAMQQLSYVRNEAARQLRVGHSMTLGLITQSAGNPFFADIATAAEDAAAEQSFSVVVGNSNEQEDRELGYLRLFEELRVRGVLLAPVSDPHAHLHRLRSHGIPSVLLDNVSTDTSISSVSVDDVAGGRLAAAHLIEVGRKRLAFVGGPDTLRQVRDRLAGARAAIGAHPGSALEVIPADALTVQTGRSIGRAIAARPAPERPDGLFAANDLVAIGILQSLLDAGIRVPRDIALVGYDDIAFASATSVPLSSVRQPTALIGRTGVEILLGATRDPGAEPRHILYQPRLIVRASTTTRL